MGKKNKQKTRVETVDEEDEDGFGMSNLHLEGSLGNDFDTNISGAQMAWEVSGSSSRMRASSKEMLEDGELNLTVTTTGVSDQEIRSRMQLGAFHSINHSNSNRTCIRRYLRAEQGNMRNLRRKGREVVGWIPEQQQQPWQRWPTCSTCSSR